MIQQSYDSEYYIRVQFLPSCEGDRNSGSLHSQVTFWGSDKLPIQRELIPQIDWHVVWHARQGAFEKENQKENKVIILKTQS